MRTISCAALVPPSTFAAHSAPLENSGIQKNSQRLPIWKLGGDNSTAPPHRELRCPTRRILNSRGRLGPAKSDGLRKGRGGEICSEKILKISTKFSMA